MVDEDGRLGCERRLAVVVSGADGVLMRLGKMAVQISM